MKIYSDFILQTLKISDFSAKHHSLRLTDPALHALKTTLRVSELLCCLLLEDLSSVLGILFGSV